MALSDRKSKKERLAEKAAQAEQTVDSIHQPEEQPTPEKTETKVEKIIEKKEIIKVTLSLSADEEDALVDMVGALDKKAKKEGIRVNKTSFVGDAIMYLKKEFDKNGVDSNLFKQIIFSNKK